MYCGSGGGSDGGDGSSAVSEGAAAAADDVVADGNSWDGNIPQINYITNCTEQHTQTENKKNCTHKSLSEILLQRTQRKRHFLIFVHKQNNPQNKYYYFPHDSFPL